MSGYKLHIPRIQNLSSVGSIQEGDLVVEVPIPPAPPLLRARINSQWKMINVPVITTFQDLTNLVDGDMVVDAAVIPPALKVRLGGIWKTVAVT